MKDEKLDYFKKLILEHLESLEADKKELKKSLLEAESIAKGGKGLPVGTVRDWKGRKYIKVAPGKWKPKYDSHSRGAKLSIAALKRKADACRSSEELLQLVLENRERFSDEMGRPLPFVKELSDYISAKNDGLETLPEGRNQKEHYADLKALKRRNSEEYNKKRAEHIRQDIDLNKVTYNQKLLSRKEAEKIIAENKNKKLTNKETSLNANYGSEGAGKLVSQKAVNKSVKNGYTEEEHFTIASHIKELFEEAKLISIEPDRDSDLNDNVKEVRRYATEFDLNGKKGFTLMTVKLNKDETNKMYALELNYLTNKKPATSGEVKDNSNHETLTKDKPRRQQASKDNIPHESEKVKKNTDNAKEKKKAADVIATVIANKDYAPERSSFREQVGAVTALLDNIPQNEKKTSAKADSSMGVTYNGKEIKPTFDTDDTHKEAIAKAEYNNDVENPVLFIPSSKTLDKTIRRMMKCRSKDESRQFMTEFGTCGDGFLYATNGRVLQRIKVDGIGGLGNTGSKMQCLKVEQVKDGWKVTEHKGIDEYGNTETLQYPNCPRVIPRNNTQKATINNNAILNKIKELDSEGYFSFDQFGEPTNRKSEQVKRLPIDVKADGLYIGSVKVGESNGIESEQKLYLNPDYIKNALQDGENTNLALADTKDGFLKAVSISSSVGDSIIMPMAAGDNEMPVDDFENSSYGKAYQEFKAKQEEKRMKKSFDLFGNETDEPVNRNEERTAKELVADILSGIA